MGPPDMETRTGVTEDGRNHLVRLLRIMRKRWSRKESETYLGTVDLLEEKLLASQNLWGGPLIKFDPCIPGLNTRERHRKESLL